MVKEKLIIKNFAGFEHIEFDFKPINIFIGPQAAGKSIVIKLAYFFKSYLYDINKFILLLLPFGKKDKNFHESFSIFFPKESWSDKEFEITYSIGDKISITIKGGKDSILNISFSPNLEALKQTYKDTKDNLNDLKNSFFIDKPLSSTEKVIDFPEQLDYTQYFIPAGRSFFSILQSNIFGLLQNGISLDPFLLSFGADYERIKNNQDFYLYHTDIEDSNFESIGEISSSILKGNYIREEDNDFLIQKDGRKINLLNASSGQQESLPLILFLQSRIGKFATPSVLYIEEPEAHLYPDAQKKIVQLLARVYNSTNSQLFITTHSPYILAAFNNLIEAGNIIKNKPQLTEDVYTIVPKEEVLKADNLIAYSIRDGKKTVLLDEENNLIAQNILDDVSNEIGAEFGKLLDLEFGE